MAPGRYSAGKLRKLEESLEAAGFVLEEVVPLFATLCSLPLPDRYPPLNLGPQRQKQQMLAAVLAWLLKEAERQPVRLVLEDLLGRCFHPGAAPSPHRSGPPGAPPGRLNLPPRLYAPVGCALACHHIAVGRLTPAQSEQMIERFTVGKALPVEVRHLLEKTNGVPLFVEELTKMVLESGLVKEKVGHYELAVHCRPWQFPRPSRLAHSRLDRQGLGKPVAQLGATLGREFSYGVLQAVAPLDEVTLQQGLEQLVRTEILYQRGLPPQALNTSSSTC